MGKELTYALTQRQNKGERLRRETERIDCTELARGGMTAGIHCEGKNTNANTTETKEKRLRGEEEPGEPSELASDGVI